MVCIVLDDGYLSEYDKGYIECVCDLLDFDEEEVYFIVCFF